MLHINKLLTVVRSLYFCFRIRGNLYLKGLRIGKGSTLIQPNRMRIEPNVTIGERSVINCYKENLIPSLFIGKNTKIGRDFQLNAYQSVKIGDEVLIADRVYISDSTHNSKDLEKSIISQGTSFKAAVVIENGAWIGINACILPGVNIGENAIIGANSVVVKDVEKNSIVSGVPAKKIN